MKYNDPIHYDRETGFDDSKCIITALQRVEINPVELCNRSCVFCPRNDAITYPNRNLHMSIETTRNIGRGLSDIDYHGRVTISGFGEPLLHVNICLLVSSLRELVPNMSRLQLITNGDRLTKKLIAQLYDAGIDRIEVNMYDGVHQLDRYNALFKDTPTSMFYIRHHYQSSDEDYGLILNNRAGSVPTIQELKEPLQKTCYLPFYKLMIDWNGDILICCQDWQRKGSISLNVNDTSIRDIWLSEQLYKYREKLKKASRCLEPCNKCNINGQLHGKSSFDLFSSK